MLAKITHELQDAFGRQQYPQARGRLLQAGGRAQQQGRRVAQMADRPPMVPSDIVD